MNTDERGMSDLVAFVLIFTVVIASIGLIAVTGGEGLASVRDAESAKSAQSGMTNVADQMTGIADHHAPARATELRLGESVVRVIDGPTIDVTVEYDGEQTITHTERLGALEYDQGGTRINVVGGAVLRIDGSHAAFVRPPPWQCGERQARVNIVMTRALDEAAISGASTLQIKTHHRSTRLLEPSNRSTLRNATAVEVALTGPYEDAWDRGMTAAGWTEDNGNYVCRLDEVDGASVEPRGAIVRSTRIGIEFIR